MCPNELKLARLQKAKQQKLTSCGVCAARTAPASTSGYVYVFSSEPAGLSPQTRIVLSSEQLIRYWSQQRRLITTFSCAVSVCMHVPFAFRSHTRMVLSMEPEYSLLAAHWSVTTGAVWPESVPTCSKFWEAVLRTQQRIVPSWKKETGDVKRNEREGPEIVYAVIMIGRISQLAEAQVFLTVFRGCHCIMERVCKLVTVQLSQAPATCKDCTDGARDKKRKLLSEFPNSALPITLSEMCQTRILIGPSMEVEKGDKQESKRIMKIRPYSWAQNTLEFVERGPTFTKRVAAIINVSMTEPPGTCCRKERRPCTSIRTYTSFNTAENINPPDSLQISSSRGGNQTLPGRR